ncbi:hypothetical protein [Nocardioides sp. NPDC127503]|uniref:hypothetical protein n=1 Tax=Nocardioides sp. NPDC127503 TaxID=3154516 RepID=UPI003332C9AC
MKIASSSSTWRHDAEARVDLAPVRIGVKAVASAASMARVRQQLRRYRIWLQTRSA